MLTQPYILWKDPLLVALNALAGRGERSPYRVVVVDNQLKVKGTLTGRRVLEVLLGLRGESIIAERGIKGILREPVNLFLYEPRHIFPEHAPLLSILQYMAENSVGHVIITDDLGVLRGSVDESAIIGRLRRKSFGIPVSDVMTDKVFTISPEATLYEAADAMVGHRVRRLPVVTDDNLVGIVTVTDVLNYILAEEKHVEMLLYDVSIEEVLSKKVGEVMSPTVISISPSSDLGSAVDKLIQKDVSGLPVVSDDGRLVGMLSRIDVLVELVRRLGASAVVEAMSL